VADWKKGEEREKSSFYFVTMKKRKHTISPFVSLPPILPFAGPDPIRIVSAYRSVIGWH
jgi:hypothetical protein